MLEPVTLRSSKVEFFRAVCLSVACFLLFSIAQGFCKLSFSLHTSFDNFPKAKSNIRVIVSFPHKDGDCVLPRSNFSFKVCKIPKPEISLFNNTETQAVHVCLQ